MGRRSINQKQWDAAPVNLWMVILLLIFLVLVVAIAFGG
jgi:cbb3-type cytochrome oxidase subunit 3